MAATQGGTTNTHKYKAFGANRSGGDVRTDHLFTGQKQDGTGLLYYKARYYDKLLGTFISPDPLIPDPSNVFAYNRYVYALGNPLKYNDPTGFCSLSGTGERDAGDSACWALADQVRTAWDVDPDWWSSRWSITPDDWMQNIAVQSFADEAYLQAELDQFWTPKYQAWGVRHPRYNPAPIWHEPSNPDIYLPGRSIADSVVADAFACADAPLWGCGNLADDIAFGIAASGALLCVGATGGGCLTVVGVFSGGAAFSGATITTRNAVVGEATWIDAGVSWTTTVSGVRYGARQGGVVGAGIATFQRAYDWWRGDR